MAPVFFKAQYFLFDEQAIPSGQVLVGRDVLAADHPFCTYMADIADELGIVEPHINVYLLHIRRRHGGPRSFGKSSFRLDKLQVLLVETRPQAQFESPPDSAFTKADISEDARSCKGQPEFLTLELMKNLRDILTDQAERLFSAGEDCLKAKWLVLRP